MDGTALGDSIILSIKKKTSGALKLGGYSIICAEVPVDRLAARKHMNDRENLDVLLVNPDDRNPVSNIPWGILSVGSYLANSCNRKVRLIDASIDGEDKLIADLSDLAKQTPLIGLSIMSRYTPFLKRAADTIKAANPACKVIVGGPHAVLCPEQTAAYANIDFVAYGEGEFTLNALIDQIAKPDPDYSCVPGLIFRQADGSLQRTSIAPAAPFYDVNYDLLDPKVLSTFGNYIQVLSGRGCSYKCTFCFNAVRGEKWRPRPAEEMVQEIEALVARFNPKVVYFRDENFFQGKQRTREFIRLYREKGFTFRWRANCRADYLNDSYINPDFLKELAEINCEAMKFGLESGSERVLEAIKKKLRVSKVKRAISWLSAEPRIRKYYSFLIGLPGETTADYKATMKLVGWAIRADPNAKIIGPQYYRLYPGGELYDQVKRDWNYQAPQSLEEWCRQYADPENDDGWDKGVEYPWVPEDGRWLAKNASLLIDSYRRIYASETKVAWSPLKRLVLRLIQISLDARFRFGVYGGLVEFKLIGLLTRIYGSLKNLRRTQTGGCLPLH
ncbi:MAG: B12-binding domain-containing radical SAM protein [Alphaproteobacteria bacterium]|nr:B12-binding domain-containing radical SAM protein [Alphaproteobacteria bacterium]